MEITKSEAVVALGVFGLSQAKSWKFSRLCRKFQNTVVEGDWRMDDLEFESKEDEALFDKIADAIEGEEEITVVEKEEVVEGVEEDVDIDNEVDELEDEVEEEETEEEVDEEEEEEEDSSPEEEEEEEEEEDDGGESVTVGDNVFKVGMFVEVDNPQCPASWIGRIVELQNENYAEVEAKTGKTWEEEFVHMTPTKKGWKVKKEKVKRLGRIEVAAKVIKDIKKKTKKEDLVKRADKAFVAQGGRCKSNEKLMENNIDTMVLILRLFGIVEEDDDKISLTS